ncbi:MAG: poly(A) polymerase, partial [Lentimonas sp.]
RNWQPPIGGEEIMKMFGIGPSKEIGTIKTELKDAILDGDITNDYTEAYKFVLQLGKELGLQSNE